MKFTNIYKDFFFNYIFYIVYNKWINVIIFILFSRAIFFVSSLENTSISTIRIIVFMLLLNYRNGHFDIAVYSL